MKINERHLSAFANSNAPIDQEGHLLKRGELNKAFQKRWFVLKGNLLFYFEKKGDKEPIGVIILEGCTVELSESIDAFAFQISFEGSGSRAYVLAAETQENMEKWMKAITCAGYDYMKLMVSELQRQLDDLNLAEQQKFSAVPKRTQQDIMRENDGKLFRNSTHKSDGNQELLIDISIPDSAASSSNKRQGRINPFDMDPVADAFQISDPFHMQNVAVLPSKKGNTSRNFEEMHAEFGIYIQQQVHENIKS